MTREEAMANLKMSDKYCLAPFTEAVKMAIEALEQEPCEDVAKECYEDLCRYFGGAKDILKNREDFKAWLDRIKWHIHKAEELGAENDDLRDQLAMRDRFQKQKLEWIPVSERLPENGNEVLVCYEFKKKRYVYIADFYGDGFHGLDDEYLTTEGRKYRKAVAWMPLPPSYQGE